MEMSQVIDLLMDGSEEDACVQGAKIYKECIYIHGGVLQDNTPW